MTPPRLHPIPPGRTSVAFAAVLSDLHRACFESTGGDVWSAEAFMSLLAMPGAGAWIAEGPDGAPVGLLLLRTVADETEIITIGVIPAARRAGVARALLGHGLADAKAKGAESAFLEVAEDNDAARRFYAAAGYAETGRRTGYYKRTDGRVDAVVMTRRL